MLARAFLQAPIFRRPDFLFLQAAMEPFHVALLYGDFDDKHWEDTLYSSYASLSKAASVPDHIREEGKFSSPDSYKEAFLKKLSDEIGRLERYKKERTSIQSKRMSLESLRQNVPDSPKLDRLLRYSITLERNFDRVLSQLDRIQRIRRGQPVEPRIDVKAVSIIFHAGLR